MAHGWTVQEVWWEPPEDVHDWESWVADEARRALDAESAPRRLVVGKSLGSLALPVATAEGLAGVWLTPGFRRQSMRQALTSAVAPQLLVGGTGDQSWDGAVARASHHEVLEIEGVDHNLEIPGNPLASVDALRRVVAGIDAYVTGLHT